MIAPLVVGNWKMNGGPAACVELARSIVRSSAKTSRIGSSGAGASFYGATRR